MRKQIQNPEGYKTLVQLIQIFQESEGNELSFREILKGMEQKNSQALQAEEESNILNVLDHYTSTTIACPDNKEKVLCIFQDLGDGQYELLADEETCQALLQEEGSLVDPDLVPFSVDQKQMDENLQKQYDRMAESIQPYEENPADLETESIRPSQIEADDQANRRAHFARSDEMANQEFGSDGLEQPHTYGNDVYDEADHQLAKENERVDSLSEFSSSELTFEQEMPDLPSDQNDSLNLDQVEADDAENRKNARTANQDRMEEFQPETSFEEQPQLTDSDSLNVQLDQANHEVERARDRAEQAEEEARIWKAQAEDSMATLNERDCMQDDQEKQNKIMKKIRKAQDRIQQQERKISDHEEQIDQNATGMMKSMHKAQIRHDKKVIDRKNRKISDLEQDLKNLDSQPDSCDGKDSVDPSDQYTD